MENLNHFLWLLTMPFSPLVEYWQFTLVMLLLITGAVWWDYSEGKLDFNSRLLFLALPLPGIYLTIFLGEIFQAQPSLVFLAYVGLGITLVLQVITFVVLKDAWRTCLCVFILLGCPILLSCATAAMAIQNLWF